MSDNEQREELVKIADEVRDDPERRDMSRIVMAEYATARFEGFGEWDRARLIANRLHAAGYSKPRTIRASDDGLRARLVDLLLTYKGTPRHKLFEYPHRDDDSRTMIGQAEAVALRIIHTLDTKEPTQ